MIANDEDLEIAIVWSDGCCYRERRLLENIYTVNSLDSNSTGSVFWD